MTGVASGRRPASAKAGAAIKSANRFTVTNVTATTPRPVAPIDPSSPLARRRRAETPTEFVGTTTVTGASASSAFAFATAARNASDAGRPYSVGIKSKAMTGSYDAPET
jgi:hypothetical protein